MIIKNRKIYKICIGFYFVCIIGLKLCGEIKFLNVLLEMSVLYFFLIGFISLDVFLMKEDFYKLYNVEV